MLSLTIISNPLSMSLITPPPPPPQTEFVGRYTVFTLSVCNILFPYYLEESLLLEFHQTLQTYSYIQDKYFKLKSKGLGPIL